MKRIRRESHTRFWMLLSLLLLLVAVRYSLQVDIPRAVYLVVIVLICLLGDQDEIIAMLMCCIPLHESVDFFYALVFCTAIYIFKSRISIRLNLSVILIFAMIIWELLHCFMSDFSIMGFIISIVPLVVLAVTMCSDLSELDYGFAVRALAMATLGVCLALFVKVLYLADFNVMLAISGIQRLGVDAADASERVSVTGGQVNPNSLGIIGVLAANGLLQLRSAGKGKRMDLVLACTIMVFCALTASRTYLVCLVLMLILMLFSQQGQVSRKIRFLALIIVLVALALTLLYLIFPDLLAYYIKRFFVADITTGRDQLMIRYHEFIMSDPRVLLFGIGLQDYGNRLTQYYMVTDNVPHNSIQELVIAWGLPGVLFFAALILIMFVVSRKQSKHQSLINYVPLMIILVKGMAGQMLNSAYTMLAFSYAYLSLCADLSPRHVQRIFTRTQTISHGSGYNINPSFRKDKKR